MKHQATPLQDIARLGNLEVRSDELERLSKEFDTIVEFVGTLQRVKAEDVSETAVVTELENVFREDSVEPSLHHRTLVEHAPHRRGGLIRAPGVFAEQDNDDA